MDEHNNDSDQGKVILTVQKSERDEVRVRETEFKGKQYIDIRIFSKNQTGDFVPTKKGITLNREKMHELMTEMTKIL
jgi:hypothetical protein